MHGGLPRTLADLAAFGLAVVLVASGHAGQGAWVGWRWTGWLVVVAAGMAWLAARAASQHRGLRPNSAWVAAAWMVPGLLTSSVPVVLAVVALAGVVVAVAAIMIGTASAVDWHPKVVVTWLAVVTALDVAALTLLRDPFRESTCLPVCDSNPLLLVRRHDLVRLVDGLWSATVSVIAMTLVVVLVRRCFPIVSVPAVARLLVAGAGLVVAVHRWFEPRPVPDGRVLETVVASSSVLLAAGFVLGALPAVSALWARHRGRRLVGRLAAATDLASVTDVLRRATGDAGLEIRVVDPAWPLHPPPQGWGVIEVRRDGSLMAVIEHTAPAGERVRAAMNPIVALSIENAAMLVRAQRHVHELAEAQRRWVELADLRRRRLERDLHDGAQQQLLVLGMDLQSATTQADPHDVAVLSSMATSAADTLGRLRSLARGSIPGALDQVGMAEGFFSLAEEAVVPMRVEIDGNESLQLGRAGVAAVHRAVRLVVAEATECGASRVDLTVRGDGGHLVISLVHDGEVDEPLTEPADRVRAAGGSWSIAAVAGAVTYEARFPCE